MLNLCVIISFYTVAVVFFFFFQHAESCIKPLLSTKESYAFLTGNTNDEEWKDWLHYYVNSL